MNKKYLVYVILLFYLSVSLVNLKSPGLQNDESFNISTAAYITKPRTLSSYWKDPENLSYFQYTNFLIFDFPVMTSLPYIGTIKSYIFAIFFGIFGINIYSIRVPFVVIGMVAVLFTYKFTKQMYGSTIAIMAILLLGTDVSQILTNRHDWGPVALMGLFKALSLYMFALWWKQRKIKHLIYGGICLGLGVWDKANFMWFLFALIPASAIAYNKELIKRFAIKELIALIIAVAIGGFPFIVYNAVNDGATFKFNKVKTEASFRYVSEYISGTKFQLRNFDLLFDGSGIVGITMGTSNVSNWLFLPILIISIFGNALFFKSKNFKNDLFFFLLFLLILLQMHPTGAKGQHHTMMLYPFPHVIIASFLGKLCSYRNDNQSLKFSTQHLLFMKKLSFLVLIVLCMLNIRNIYSFHKLNMQIGGANKWTDAIYEVADYLKEKNSVVVCLDWGVTLNLQSLTGGKIPVFEWLRTPSFEYGMFDLNAERPDPEKIIAFTNMLAFITDPQYVKSAHRYIRFKADDERRNEENENPVLFLRHPSELTEFKNVDAIYKQILEKFNLVEIPVKIFYQKDKKEVLGLYRLERASTMGQI